MTLILLRSRDGSTERRSVGRLVRLVNKLFICQLSTWRSFVDECAAYIVVSRQSTVVSGSSLLEVYFSTASTQHVLTSSMIDVCSALTDAARRCV